MRHIRTIDWVLNHIKEAYDHQIKTGNVSFDHTYGILDPLKSEPDIKGFALSVRMRVRKK